MDESLGRSSYYLLGRLLLSCQLWECRNTERAVSARGVRCLPLNSSLIFAAAAASQLNVAAAESIHGEIFSPRPRSLSASSTSLPATWLCFTVFCEISAFRSLKKTERERKRPTLLQQLYVCDWNTAHNVPLQVRDWWESVTASLWWREITLQNTGLPPTLHQTRWTLDIHQNTIFPCSWLPCLSPEDSLEHKNDRITIE